MTSASTPPAKFAASVLASAGLSQAPIPVRELLAERATIKSDRLPDGFDGILVRKRGMTPKVFVATNVPETRIRFTYGHELGHLIIPWHTGTFICQPGNEFDGNSPEAQIEREANDFASELLMPSPWLSERLSCAPADIPKAILDCAEKAHVSLAATVRAFGRACEYAAHAVLVNAFGGMEAWSKTPRWHGVNVGSWTPDVREALNTAGASVASMPVGQKMLYVAVHIATVPIARPRRASTQIIRDFLTSTYPDPKMQNSMSMRINGVVGSANNRSSSRDVNGLLSALSQRFAMQEYSEILKDPVFQEFLSAKAFELSEK
jgi:hypothetical protein